METPQRQFRNAGGQRNKRAYDWQQAGKENGKRAVFLKEVGRAVRDRGGSTDT